MKKKIIHLLTVIWCIAFMVSPISCTSEKSTLGYEQEFVKMLVKPDVKDINKSVILKLAPNFPMPKFGDTTFLESVNQSNQTLYFPVGRNIQLFAFDKEGNNWIKVQNLMKYGGSDTYLPPVGQNFEDDFPVSPDTHQLQTDTIRVCVTGFIMEGSKVTGTPVTACIDVKYVS